MTGIKPFLSMITIQDVDHEDAMIPIEGADTEMLSFLGAISGQRFEAVTPSGIGAGVIIDVGSTVGDVLQPGFKIYYQKAYARKIGDVWVVDARAVVAYEELDA